MSRFASLLLLLLTPVAFAERLTVDPETNLSLDFKVLETPPCILIPATAYDPQACEGIPQEKNRGVRALVILKQPDHVFVVTVASIARPGIGQMYDRNIEGFIEGARQNLSQEFGAPMHAMEVAGKAYTVEKVNGIPVARWEYTTELPDADPRANTASAVVYLIPSGDTLDILSINTHRQELEAARGVGEKVISSLQVPLTIDAESFGGDMTFAMGMAVAKVVVPLALVLGVAGWMGWRYFKIRNR